MQLRALAFSLLAVIAVLVWALVRPGARSEGAAGLVSTAGPAQAAEGLEREQGPVPSRAPGQERVADRAAAAGDSSERAPGGSGPLGVGVRVLGPSGAPVLGATLSLPAELGGAAVRSDAMGYARFQGSVARAGEGLATVFAPGLARAYVALAWEPGGETWLGDVLLSRAGSVRGLIVDEHRAPARDIEVFVLEAGKGGHTHEPSEWVARGAGVLGRTDPFGTFRIEGVPEGTHAAFARHSDRPWSSSAAFLVAPGAETSGIEVRLAPAAPESYVSGVLLDVDGTPTGAASILYDPVGDKTYGYHRARPAEDGRFELALARPVAHRLVIEPDDWEASVVRVPSVEPGARELVLRLEPPRWLWVRVRDETGEPLTRGRIEALFAVSDQRQPRAISDLWPDGRARLHRPLEAFRLRADVPGYERLTTGPYPLGVPEPVELVLREIPAVRGVVTRAGTALADAEVGLYLFPRVPEPRLGYRISEVKSDASGRFVLPIRRPASDAPTRGIVMVRAADGVHAFSEPFVLDPELGVRGLRIEVGAGGAISGRLLLPAGMRAGGWSIVAHDSLETRRSAPAADDGAFLLEHLAPGRWTLAAEDPAGRYLRYAEQDPAATVVAGRVVRCDLHVPDLAFAQLRGRLEIEGHATLTGWSVTCHTIDSKHSRETVLEPDGTFELALDASGRVRLSFRSVDPRWSHLTVTRREQLLRGENECVVKFAVGEVFGTYSVPGAEGARAMRLALFSTDADVDYRAVLDTGGGSLAPKLVPAGEAYLRVRDSPEVAQALAVRAADLELSAPTPKVRVPRGGRLDLSQVRGDD